mmetsp:Transcript_2194/g.6333  ORF Transcript_2194/g.6333 Transcript_2194/m.6333 type:complete len:228 (-) Transcript_2194:1045-1728(-)
MLCLGECLARHAGLFHSFTASKVDKVQLAVESDALLLVGRGEVQSEDGVRAAALSVHLCGSGAPLRRGVLHEFVDGVAVARVHGDHLSICHEALAKLILGNLVIGWLVLHRRVCKKIFDLLAVDLDETDFHLKGPTAGLELLLVRCDLLNGSGNDAAVVPRGGPLHRVRLSAACLPIAEETDVEAIESRLHELRDLDEEVLLGSAHAKDVVIGKVLGLEVISLLVPG